MELSTSEKAFLMGIAHFLYDDIEWHSKSGKDREEFWAYVPFGQLQSFANAFGFDKLDPESFTWIKTELRATYIVINMSDCLDLLGFDDTDLFVKNACWTDEVRFSSKIK